jgi:hypothetical protein
MRMMFSILFRAAEDPRMALFHINPLITGSTFNAAGGNFGGVCFALLFEV